MRLMEPMPWPFKRHWNQRDPRYRVRIETPLDAAAPFSAALIIDAGFCTDADPVLRRFIGVSACWLKWHCHARGWAATVIADEPAKAEPPPQLTLHL